MSAWAQWKARCETSSHDSMRRQRGQSPQPGEQGRGYGQGGVHTAETEKDLEVFACLRYRENRTEAEAEAHGDE
jgi:hypothetical protein